MDYAKHVIRFINGIRETIDAGETSDARMFYLCLSRGSAGCARGRSQMSRGIVFHLNIDVNVAHAKPSCGPRSLSVNGGARTYVT